MALKWKGGPDNAKKHVKISVNDSKVSMADVIKHSTFGHSFYNKGGHQ